MQHSFEPLRLLTKPEVLARTGLSYPVLPRTANGIRGYIPPGSPAFVQQLAARPPRGFRRGRGVPLASTLLGARPREAEKHNDSTIDADNVFVRKPADAALQFLLRD